MILFSIQWTVGGRWFWWAKMGSSVLLYISPKEAISSNSWPAWRPACYLTDSWIHRSGIREERSAWTEDSKSTSQASCFPFCINAAFTSSYDPLSQSVANHRLSTLQGKVFPKLRNRSPHGSCDSVSDKEEDEATDYVFRIIFPGNQMEFSECL